MCFIFIIERVQPFSMCIHIHNQLCIANLKFVHEWVDALDPYWTLFMYDFLFWINVGFQFSLAQPLIFRVTLNDCWLLQHLDSSRGKMRFPLYIDTEEVSNTTYPICTTSTILIKIGDEPNIFSYYIWHHIL